MPALDGLRGVAILLVVAHHLFDWPFGGSIGVDLFFAVSGFLITTLLLEERARTGAVSLGGFYARRARRLFPALAALLAFYLVASALRGTDGLRMVAELGLYTGNIVQAFGHPGQVQPLSHLWTLAEEEQFYLVWPVVLLVLVKMRRPGRWIAALLGAFVVYRLTLVGAGVTGQRLYMGPDLHAEGLFAGSLLAVIRMRGGFAVRESVVQAALAVFLMAALIAQPLTIIWNWGLPVIELAAVVLVASAVTKTEFARLLEWRPLVWLGLISYSLYLWQPVILWLVDGRGTIALPVSLLAAWLSYRFIEQPFRHRRNVSIGAPAVST